MKDLPMWLLCIGLFLALLITLDRALDIEFPEVVQTQPRPL